MNLDLKQYVAAVESLHGIACRSYTAAKTERTRQYWAGQRKALATILNGLAAPPANAVPACGTCRFSVTGGMPACLRCHLNPPQYYVEPQTQWGWDFPPVDNADWCGRWQPRQLAETFVKDTLNLTPT